MSVVTLDKYRPPIRAVNHVCERKRPQRKSRREKDYSSQDGAQKIADAVASYWFMRGYEIEAEAVPYDPAAEAVVILDRHARTDVRSDMVNGLPRGCVWRNGKVVRA